MGLVGLTKFEITRSTNLSFGKTEKKLKIFIVLAELVLPNESPKSKAVFKNPGLNRMLNAFII